MLDYFQMQSSELQSTSIQHTALQHKPSKCTETLGHQGGNPVVETKKLRNINKTHIEIGRQIKKGGHQKNK